MSKSFRKIEKQIVLALKPYKPKKIFLFGNRAFRKSKKDSDILSQRIPEARLYLFKIDYPFDILVMTPKEVKKRLEMGNFFIEEILKKGKVLYETKRK